MTADTSTYLAAVLIAAICLFLHCRRDRPLSKTQAFHLQARENRGSKKGLR